MQSARALADMATEVGVRRARSKSAFALSEYRAPNEPNEAGELKLRTLRDEADQARRAHDRAQGDEHGARFGAPTPEPQDVIDARSGTSTTKKK